MKIGVKKEANMRNFPYKYVSLVYSIWANLQHCSAALNQGMLYACHHTQAPYHHFSPKFSN